MGDKFTVSRGSTDAIWNEGMELLNQGGPGVRKWVYTIIMAAFFGRGGVCINYSVNPGLSNAKLGLKGEDLDAVTKTIMDEQEERGIR